MTLNHFPGENFPEAICFKALSHHDVWPERMPTYTKNSSKIVRVQERPMLYY